MKVWDSFIRLYHWLQVGLIVACWRTAEEGEMEWHLILAACLMALWITRIIWGFVGSDTARFRQFVKGPAMVVAFARTLLAGKTVHQVGHNPVGALMVVALLVLLAVQWGTGLFASDDILIEGPLYSLISEELSVLLTQIHHINFNVISLLVVFHIAAVVWHQLKGEPLVKAMITGRRADLSTAGLDAPKLRNSLIAWAIFGLTWACTWWWIVSGSGF